MRNSPRLPISALLFLLNIAVPMKSANIEARFGYANDIGVLGIARKISQSLSVSQHEVDSLSDWANNNAVTFDTQKSYVIQFSTHRRETLRSIQMNSNNIESTDQIPWIKSSLSNIILQLGVVKH